jgi:hypothetical protein
MGSFPATSVDVVIVATPPVDETVPRDAPALVNETVPVAPEESVAVNVTD